MKLTFKTIKPVGRYKSFHGDYTVIKFNKKQIGMFIGDGDNERHYEPPYQVRLMIYKDDINSDGNPNCEWKWITYKHKEDTLDGIKQWLNKNIDTIIKGNDK